MINQAEFLKKWNKDKRGDFTNDVIDLVATTKKETLDAVVDTSVVNDLVKYLNDKKTREILWLNHGCSIPALYGDDGEMQCNSCMLDFKRMPIGEIIEGIKQGPKRYTGHSNGLKSKKNEKANDNPASTGRM